MSFFLFPECGYSIAAFLVILADIMNKSPPIDGHPYPITPQYYCDRIATAQEIKVVVSKADFDKARSQLMPSVTMSELRRYEELRRQFSGEASPDTEDVDENMDVQGGEGNGVFQLELQG